MNLAEQICLAESEGKREFLYKVENKKNAKAIYAEFLKLKYSPDLYVDETNGDLFIKTQINPKKATSNIIEFSIPKKSSRVVLVEDNLIHVAFGAR